MSLGLNAKYETVNLTPNLLQNNICNIRVLNHVEMKDLALCTPEIFYTPKMQQFIMNRCNDIDKQWIYFMIAEKPLGENEQIFETHEEWILCKDVHQGNDFRMLVIFKDVELKTIRDLRQEHIPLLLTIKREVKRYLRQIQNIEVDSYKIYFHYTPSVYQLHAHVSIPGQFYNNWRTHNINYVISNLRKDTFYYRNAILIFSMNKSIKNLNIHQNIEFPEVCKDHDTQKNAIKNMTETQISKHEVNRNDNNLSKKKNSKSISDKVFVNGVSNNNKAISCT